MKPEQLSEAMDHLPEDLVEETLTSRNQGKKRPVKRYPWIGIAACLVLVLGIFLWRGNLFSKEEPRQDVLYSPTVSYEGILSDPSKLPDDLYRSPTESTNHTLHASPIEQEGNIGVQTLPKPVSLSASRHLLWEPSYPNMPTYPGIEGTSLSLSFDRQMQWLEERETVYDAVKNFTVPEGFMEFYRNTAQTFLQGRSGENPTYSPLNLYMALSMLAELTDGTTRGEILTLLGQDTIEKVRENATALWISNYCDDGALTSIMGNSLWLRDDMAYENKSLENLAEIYYAYSYKGDMSEEDFTRDLQEWINYHTGGLLQEQVGELAFDERTVAALVSTLYFQASWEDKFQADLTQSREFYGETATVAMDFLHKEGFDLLYDGENFKACTLPMSQGTSMWFFLPEDGVTPQALLQQEELYDLSTLAKETDCRTVELSLYLPKFDITAQTDLKEGLKQLGLTQVFDPSRSDFSPLTRETAGIAVTRVEHCTRIRIDEEGCEAGAYVFMPMDGMGAFENVQRVELVFDRPFLFVITGRTGQPLFTGIVDQP